MGIKVFFSFDYHRDKQTSVKIVEDLITKSDITPLMGYYMWWNDDFGQRARERAQQRLLDAVEITDLTVLFIGLETADHVYINYAIAKTLERGNPLVGVLVTHLDPTCAVPPENVKIPADINRFGITIVPYQSNEQLAGVIEKELHDSKSVH